MSWTRIWVHLVFTTKLRKPFLKDNLLPLVCRHIHEQGFKKEIPINIVNGYHNHLHCLLLLPRDKSLSKCVQLIKGESSYWINKSDLTPGRFSWQDDYWAASVSDAHKENTRKYIARQIEHHRKESFKEELARMIENQELRGF